MSNKYFKPQEAFDLNPHPYNVDISYIQDKSQIQGQKEPGKYIVLDYQKVFSSLVYCHYGFQ